MIPYSVRLYNEGSTKTYLDDDLSRFCQANGEDWCTVVAIPKLTPTHSSNPGSPSKKPAQNNEEPYESPAQSLVSSPTKTSVSERVHEYVQKVAEYEYHTDNGSSGVTGDGEGRSIQDRANEIISLDDSSSGADTDNEFIDIEGDPAICLTVVHNFPMDGTSTETFYVMMYPLNETDTLAWISVDFAKRVVKTLKKPIHRMRANKWFQGLKTQSFESLAEKFPDISNTDIELVVCEINKRPNIHFESSSNVVELRDFQVSFNYI